MKILLFIILFIPAIGASAQTDTLVMNDGHIVPCQITASNYNFLSVMIDSTNYIVEKKFLKRFTLYSNTQPSLVVKNMDYQHSNNPKYQGLGHPIKPLDYSNPLKGAGNSLIATGFMIIAGGTMSGAGFGSGRPVLGYIGTTVGGLSIVPLIIAGAKLIEASERNKKYKFLR